MELTLESAFSTGGMVGHLSYLLLVISMMMRNISMLRILVIASALAGISYDWFWLKDPVGVFWESTLVLVNVIQLALLYWKNLTARFDSTELAFLNDKLPGLSRGKSRELLNTGRWEQAPEGTVLTRQGEKVRDLVYIASGAVDIVVGGSRVSQCHAGNFIGEMSILGDEPASATTVVTGNAKLWKIDESGLRRMIAKSPDIEREIEASFSRNFRDKLIHANFLISSGKVP